MGRRTITYQDREFEAQEIEFRVVEDGSVTLELEDGAKLRVRPVVVTVLKTNERTPEGERVYLIRQIVNVALREPPTEDNP